MIGRNVIRNDGVAKVTGRGVYGAEERFPGMLYAACRYTEIVCGKVRLLDLEPARQAPGVAAVAAYPDVPGDKRIGAIRKDQYVFVDDRVFYTGDVHAIVAAETRELAWAAADRIAVDYEPMPAIFDIEEAIKPDAPSVQPDFPDNVVVHYPLRKGDPEKGFAESAHILERVYHTGFQEHAYIEPEAVIAEPDPITGGVKLHGSIQNPFSTRKLVAGFLNLRLNQVNVIPSLMGGSFGGKDDILSVMGCRVALLAMMTGRPVQLVNSRENSFRESYKRHPYRLRYKAGFDKSGLLKAMGIDILADSGAYSCQSFFVIWRSVVQATGPYNIPNVRTDIRAVYTNNPYTGAFRGFGSPQVIFAVESLMDEIAATVGIDPVTIRERNGFTQDSVTASGQPLSGHRVSLMEALHTATDRSAFRGKHAAATTDPRFKRGIGLAVSYRGCSLGAEGVDATSAIVGMQADGSVYVGAALHENGQGLQTTFAMIAAEVLGCEIGDVCFIAPQTAIIADGGPTVASRSTLMGGRAVQLAAEKVRSELFESIRDRLGVASVDDTNWCGRVIRSNNDREVPLSEAVTAAIRQGRCLTAHGWFKGPDATWDEETGQGAAYFTYVYGCQVAEVEVDVLTGRIEVKHITAVHDVGRVINPLGAKGQVCGGVAQGLGYGMLEDFAVDGGRVTSSNFDEYLIPTAPDVPPIDVVLLENPDPFGPFGAKSLGEPTLELGAAAIANAVANATGRRFYEIPLTLERVFLGQVLKKPGRESEKSIVRGKNTAYLGKLEVTTPECLDEALDLLSGGDYQPLAGGTDILVRLRKSAKPRKLLNISRISELKASDGPRIGGGITITDLAEHFTATSGVGAEAALSIGSVQIRNRATLAGNLVNAAPCADTAPPLLLRDATVTLLSRRGERTLPLRDFLIGQYRSDLRPDELLLCATLADWTPNRSLWYKLGRRQAVNIGRLSVALEAIVNDRVFREVRIAMGAMWSHPVRLDTLETIFAGRTWNHDLRGEAENLLLELFNREIGGRWSSPYKIPVATGLILDMLEKATGGFA
jgi:CO/xanthine dehydrogenase Mo-binding subunit/CO/xanthine dehydrogenase FAD-binding subunit